jgi:hypothetical protein
MKLRLKLLSYWLLITIVVYLAFAIGNYEASIALWGEGSRTGFAVLFGINSIVHILVYSAASSEK